MQLFSKAKNVSMSRAQQESADKCLIEPRFRHILELERRRCERSGNSLLLAVVPLQHLADERVEFPSTPAVRTTDVFGWYEQGKVLGLILTELRNPEVSDPRPSIELRLKAALGHSLNDRHEQRLKIEFHLFPQSGRQSKAESAIFYSDGPDHAAPRIAKRCVDILGSVAALLLLSPVLALTALVVKLSSRGPAMHRQTRVGRRGNTFTMLKFRTMFENCDPKTHRDYVTNLIAGKDVPSKRSGEAVVYKIVNDPRVTRLGKLLRRSSLDELPQLFNILKGEMSLVGPRPPLPYECENYCSWHWRRIMEVKPGLTGLWQVRGRSQTSFDGMVRLDLQYIERWSLWLDLKILLETPLAVLSGKGAY
jgi:lipopolysaccharide/colanic/teichoic acid biosynthesis glycosyltransferase